MTWYNFIMLLSDLINHTTSVLPLFTDKFTTNKSIISIVKSLNTVTVTSSNHGIKAGNTVILSGIKTDVQLTSITNNISISSISRLGGTVTVITSDDHNLDTMDKVTISGADQANYNGTFSIKVNSSTSFTYLIGGTPVTPATGSLICMVHDKAFATSSVDSDLTEGFVEKVDISSTESLYNGTFDLIKVVSQKLFIFKVVGTPSSNTGVLTTFYNIGFNGVVTVETVPDSDTFTYTLNDDRLTTGSGPDMKIMYNPRISGAASLQRAINSYTKFDTGDIWGFFVYQGMSTSDDRTVNNDSKNERELYSEYKLRLINDLTFYVFIPTSDDLSGRKALDVAQSLAKPIYKSLAGYVVPNVFSSPTQTMLMPASHSTVDDDETVSAFLMYAFDFQSTEFMQSNSDGDSPGIFMPNSGDTLPDLYTSSFRVFNWVANNELDENVRNVTFKILDE